MKRLISLTLTFIMILSLLLTVPFGVGAAQTANFSMKVQKYFNGSYINDVTVSDGDIVTLFVQAESAVNNVAGLTMEISFDSSKLQYKEDSFISYIDDKAADSSATIKDGKLLVMFDTTSKQTTLNGNVFSVAFTVVSGAQPGSALFSASVTELFDSSSKAQDIPFGVIKDVSIEVKETVISDEVIAAFEKVVNVVYKPGTDEDSADDIVAAITVLSSLNNAQIEMLKKEYPELLDAVKTAKSRYSELQQNAAVETVNKEVEAFLSEYSDVFGMNPETITLSDKERINSAITYLGNVLSAAAKSRIPSDKKDLLKQLSSKIEELTQEAEELEEAKVAAAEFKENYKILLTADETVISSSYSDLALLLEEAELVYGMMSEAAKGLLKPEREFMDAIKLKIDAAFKATEEQAEIAAIASEFMQKWKYVFTLNDFNVTLGDESIVDVFLKEYEVLSDGVKAILETRVSRVYGLAETIESLKSISGDQGDSGTKTETIYVEVPGETVIEKVEVPGETIYVPGETITEKVEVPGETIYLPGETVTEKIEVPGETIYVPGETIYTPGETIYVDVPGETVTQTVTETVTKTVEKGIGQLIFWLVIILGSLILTTILPIIALLYKKREETIVAGGIDDEE